VHPADQVNEPMDTWWNATAYGQPLEPPVTPASVVGEMPLEPPVTPEPLEPPVTPLGLSCRIALVGAADGEVGFVHAVASARRTAPTARTAARRERATMYTSGAVIRLGVSSATPSISGCDYCRSLHRTRQARFGSSDREIGQKPNLLGASRLVAMRPTRRVPPGMATTKAARGAARSADRGQCF
jgi:hypothetical protein